MVRDTFWPEATNSRCFTIGRSMRALIRERGHGLAGRCVESAFYFWPRECAEGCWFGFVHGMAR